MSCAPSWDRESLIRELDYVGRIFRGSEDSKGRKLFWKCEEIIDKLKGGLTEPVVSRAVLMFFQGEIICEELPNDVCAFSISSSGKRCLLENLETEKGVEYQCSTSDVVVHGMSEHIETEVCVNACGVDRRMIGISSDSLLEPQLTVRLCSPDCYHKCPNIIDLYYSLAAGEGS